MHVKVDPMDDLFQKIGSAYVQEVLKIQIYFNIKFLFYFFKVIKNFGTSHFYSADIFNEMVPKSE